MLNKIFILLFLSLYSLQASWSEYKNLFITKDGRVIDRVNKDITHSEAVGYAMYLSIKNNDLDTFQKIHQWSKNNLLKNEYGLVSWKWGKAKDNSWGVLDTNNASDGDLWIAYDNLLMYELSKDETYKEEALELIKNIKKHLLIKEGSSLYLLPGKLGFNSENCLEINLSYYIFFIFDKFFEYDKDLVWNTLKADGIELLKKARFSPLMLNPDWIKIEKKTAKIHLSKNNMFGYDALRIPFNILKSSMKEKDKLLEPYKQYLNAMKVNKVVYGVSNLKEGSISLYNYSLAHLSIYNMLDKYFNNTEVFKKEANTLKENSKNDYYSYSINIFTTFK